MGVEQRDVQRNPQVEGYVLQNATMEPDSVCTIRHERQFSERRLQKQPQTMPCRRLWLRIPAGRIRRPLDKGLMQVSPLRNALTVEITYQAIVTA
jgi:hypothetical protein